MNTVDVALICKALGDSNRLQIVQMLSEGEKCGCKLLEAFEITQPTLSHHMKILCDAEIVVGRKDGKWVHYSIDEAGAERAQMLLRQQLTVTESGEQTEKCCDT